jgi:hypothetical protein
LTCYTLRVFFNIFRLYEATSSLIIPDFHLVRLAESI